MSPYAPNGEWRPPKFAQAFEWYARQFVRFVVGPAIIGWELLVDDGHDLAVLLVGFMVMTSMDMRALVRNLVREARFERKTLKDLLEDSDREEDSRE